MKKILIIAFSILFLTSLSYSADTSTVSVTATVVSRGYCWFDTSTAALNFGNLDPSNPVDVNANTLVIFHCWRWGGIIFQLPVTFFIGDDDGLYKTGPNGNRMRHSTILTEYIPYSFNLNPTSGTVPGNPFNNYTLNISGTVRGVDYENAATGSYRDTVTISIIP